MLKLIFVCALSAFSVLPAAAQTNPAGTARAAPQPDENVVLPPLHLSDQQRDNIRKALLTVHTEVNPARKSAKPAAGFEPKINASVPAALKLDALPEPLVRRMPVLKEYMYLKFKGQIVIVNAMTRRIVDVFGEG